MGKESVDRLPLEVYDKIFVGFSGGKDSIACVLHLLDAGVDESQIELMHHHIDGEKSGLMDWPVTAAYCKAFAQAFNLPLLFQWREGGFEREMMRDNEPTGDVFYETLEGDVVRLPSQQHRLGTRKKFPQVSADLSVRWCSAYLKIDVCSRVIANDPRFKTGKYLLVTGERREESAARAKYLECEAHRTNGKARLVHQWRPVIDYSEQDVWDIMKKYQVNPHPAYHLRFGRVSCLACIFGNDNQWAAVKDISPDTFERIAQYEEEFETTIHRTKTVRERAEAGTSLAKGMPNSLIQLSLGEYYDPNDILVDDWQMPAGAFAECGGPT